MIIRNLRPHSRTGGIVVFAAIAFASLIALAGLVIDGGNLFLTRQRLQNAADAAVLAAAQRAPSATVDEMRATATSLLDLNGAPGLSPTVVKNYGGNANQVELTVTTGYQPTLLAVLGIRNITIGVRAVGQGGTGPGDWSPWGMDTFFGADGVQFMGNSVLSGWDSTVGAWGGANAGLDAKAGTNVNLYFEDNAGVVGDVVAPGTVTMIGNSTAKSVTAGGNISMSDNAVVSGNATSNGTISTLSNAQVLGTKTQGATNQFTPIDLPDIDFGNVTSTNDNANIPGSPSGNPPSINVAGNAVVTLPPGTYYLQDIVITGNGVLRITGPTKIYMKGTLQATGNAQIQNSNATPGNFQVFNNGTADVNIGGNGTFSGAIYAPNARLHLHGNGVMYGNMVGKSILHEGNGAFRLDRGLLGTVRVTQVPIEHRLQE